MPAPSAIRGIGGPPFSPARVPTRTLSSGGGITATSSSSVEGVFQIAFDDDFLEPAPTWTRIDDPGGALAVQTYEIDRGRHYELDRTGTGTATVTVMDTAGLLDPTNTTSPYYNKLNPGKQAAIALRNPVTDEWTTIFRGHVKNYRHVLDQTERFDVVEVELVDVMDYLAAVEVVPDTYGNTVPEESEGDVYYDPQPVDDRIFAALADAAVAAGLTQWPASMLEVFSGNVPVKGTVYASRNPLLAVIQDAADAEFPGVANFYISKDGKPTFHGRLARFNPDGYPEFINQWRLADIPNAGA